MLCTYEAPPYKPSFLMPLVFPRQGQRQTQTLSSSLHCHRSERSRTGAPSETPEIEIGGPGMAANVGAGRSASGGGGGAGGGTVAGSGGVATTTAVCRPSGSRWTPTPEQIRILKELYYGCGIRSPNSEQIQRITAMLRQHGKIEGKNVFYWFQNHKARERQKRRLTNLDVVNLPMPAATAAAGAADASTHLGVLSLSSPSSGAAPPSPTLGFYAGNGGAGSTVLMDTSSDWGGSAAMATETCFLQDYMGVMGTGSASPPWACFSSSDMTVAAAAAARAPTTVTTRAPQTLPLFPTGGDGDDSQPRRLRHGVPVPAGEAVRGGSSSSRFLPFWGAAPTTASATSVGIQHQHQQQHQLLQLQEQYSFYSNTTTQLPGTGSQDASAAAASLELSLSSWCAPYPAGTM